MAENCLICGKPTKKKDRIYCSRKCYGKSKIIPHPPCQTCGGKIKKSDAIYCSRYCYYHRFDALIPSEKKCELCGKIMRRIDYTSNSIFEKRIFCSGECSRRARKKIRPFCEICGEMLNPYQKRFCSKVCYGNSMMTPLKKVICKYCGKEFKTERKGRKFCSYGCSNSSRAKKYSQSMMLEINGQPFKKCSKCGTPYSVDSYRFMNKKTKRRANQCRTCETKANRQREEQKQVDKCIIEEMKKWKN